MDFDHIRFEFFNKKMCGRAGSQWNFGPLNYAILRLT